MQALDVAVIRCKVRGRGAPIWPLQVNGEEPWDKEDWDQSLAIGADQSEVLRAHCREIIVGECGKLFLNDSDKRPRWSVQSN